VRINDAIWGALFIIGSAAVLFHIQDFPKIPGQNVGPALFPGVVAAGIGICGLLLVVRGLRARAARAGDEAKWFVAPSWLASARHFGGFLVFIGVNLFYLFAAAKLGFLPTGMIYLFALMWVLRVRLSVAIPVAILTTFAIHYVFYKLLKVPLPWGILTPYAW
jgi:putative tricarboxylic transport membrane protein